MPQSKLIDVNTLENPQSRAEAYLHYINNTGRIAFNQLPSPQSRIEYLIMYLCEQIHLGNIGGGGGGVAPIEYIRNAELAGEILTLTKQDGSAVRVDLTPYIEKWEDLDHVEKYGAINLVEYSKRQNGIKFNSNGQSIENHIDYGLVSFNVNGNQDYTLLRHRANHLRVRLDDVSGNLVQFIDMPTSIRNGWNRAKFRTPQNASVATLELYVKQDNEKDVMILEGDQLNLSVNANKPIPFADGQLIQVGSEISLKFDNSDSNLKSTTVNSAIKELSEKLDSNALPITDYPIVNKLNPKEMVLGRRYDNTGPIVSDSSYATYTYPCTSGQTFTIAKRFADNIRYVYLTQDDVVVETGNMPKNTREWIHYKMTVPANPTIAKIGFNINVTVNATQVMIFDGHNDLPAGTQYVPYLAEKLLDGDKVAHSFNNLGTNLSSSTTKEAIEELALSKVDKYTTTFNRYKSYKDYTAKYYRIPSLLATNKGTLLSFADVRYNTAKDQSLIDIGVARSVDDGTLWNNAIAMKNTGQHSTESRVMDSTSVFVPNSNKIILLAGGWDSGTSNWTQSTATPDPNWNPFIVTSTDDGLTWSNRESLKGRVANEPNNTVAWLGGVGTGIVKKKGNNIGRIILPIQICVRDANANRNVVKAGCIYSDDNGVNWTMSTKFAEDGTSENMIAEIGNGDLIMIARRDSYASKGAFISTDGGETWELHRTLSGAFTHGRVSCQGSWITIELNGQTIGLLSHPKNTSNSYQRDNITIYMYNFDNPSQGIVEFYNVYPYLGNASGAGYSSLCYYKNIHGVDKLAIAFETNGNIEFRDITDVLHSKNITLINNKLIELSDKKVDKYNPSFAADLTVENLKITGSPIVISRSSTSAGIAGTKTLAGDKNASIPQGTKVSKILVGVNGYTEGETVTGVEVYAVNKANDTIVERIVYEGTGVARIPKGITDGVLYVDVEVNKSFNDEVYFITRLKKNGSKGMYLGGTLTTGIAFDKQTDDQELAQGSGIPIGSSTRRIPNIIVYGKVSLSNAFVDATLNNSNGIDFTRADGTTKTVNIPNTGGGTAGVTSVNGKQGVVVLDGTHINATVGNDNRSIQDHLTTIDNRLNTVNTRSITNDNRLTKLENKVPNIQVGDIISTYNTTMGDVYTAGNATFLYCGSDMTVSVNTYPQLATALGIKTTGNFKFPVVQDITHKYDHGVRNARRRHYICAKISY